MNLVLNILHRMNPSIAAEAETSARARQHAKKISAKKIDSSGKMRKYNEVLKSKIETEKYVSSYTFSSKIL